MALPLSLLFFFFFLSLYLAPFSLQQHQPTAALSPAEQESLYLALESVNPSFPWRSIYPDDLCLSPPHGVVCDYFPAQNDTVSPSQLHVVELNFGVVSDFSPNPSCSSDAAFPFSLSSFPSLRKLFFYRCFTGKPVSLPAFTASPELEELVFIDNPSLAGSLSGTLGNFTRLRRLILTGSNVSGNVPNEITYLPSLKQLTLTGNNLGGAIPFSIGNLHSLMVLDLSKNGFQGSIPVTVGQLKNLLKLDFSSNILSGKIPETLKDLQSLEFLDLSYNKLGSYGVPAFLGDIPSLRELYLSGNSLGGKIPEIWENLEGILGIGLSGLGLVGNIPPSMGVYLRNAVYIGLDNNQLEGSVPMEFGLLENLHEMHLENNQLSGKIPFPEGFIARVGVKLKLEGNSELCVDEEEEEGSSSNSKKFGYLSKLKACNGTEISRSTSVNDPSLSSSSSPSLFGSWSLVVQVVLGIWSFCMFSTQVI